MPRHHHPRAIRRALRVLEELPLEAQADLVERLIDRLDAATPDPDLEPDVDGEYDDHPALDVHGSEDEPAFPGPRLRYLRAQSTR